MARPKDLQVVVSRLFGRIFRQPEALKLQHEPAHGLIALAVLLMHDLRIRILRWVTGSRLEGIDSVFRLLQVALEGYVGRFQVPSCCFHISRCLAQQGYEFHLLQSWHIT